jgi:ribose 5-phosphate isomerase A
LSADSANTAASIEQNKQRAARAALEFLCDDMIVGIGTGSTVNALIDLLPACSTRLRGAVSSSEASSARLRAARIAVLDLNDVSDLPLYIDGADEADRARRLIKGGGGALTREKITAAVAQRFVCIIDNSKLVKSLGRGALPLEVIPAARAYVARQLTALGGRAVWRQNFITDNGNHILDVYGLDLHEPRAVEAQLQQLAGVVCVGLFAARPADLMLVGTAAGVQRL